MVQSIEILGSVRPLLAACALLLLAGCGQKGPLYLVPAQAASSPAAAAASR